MDACIARGGISHVLSQARASLKNPSRPFTPRASGRPLFHGDDYRPGSRPSSSYTVGEMKALVASPEISAPGPKTVGLLPPKAAPPRKGPAPPPPKSQSAGIHTSGSTNHLKLVHAPVQAELSDGDSDDGGTGEMYQRSRDQDDHLEASLELPSHDRLWQAYASLKHRLQELVTQPQLINASSLDQLCAMANSLRQDSALAASSHGKHSDKIFEVTDQLFSLLCETVLDRWAHSAECVLALTPCVLEIFALDCQRDRWQGDDKTSKLVMLGKLLFMLSKDTTNDSHFYNVRYVEATLAMVAKSHHNHKAVKRKTAKPTAINNVQYPMKTLIYLMGTLKNLSNADDKVIKLLATNGAIATLSDTLDWRSSDPIVAKEIAQFLIQATGVLRNLSVCKAYQKQFVEAQVASRLTLAIPEYIVHLELMVNVSRILSKLTLHEQPRAQINQDSGQSVLNLLSLVRSDQNPSLSFVDQQQAEHRFQDTLLVRVYFVLGNLCAGNDHNRRTILEAPGGISKLIEVMEFCALQYQAAESQERTRDTEQAADVLVRLVRLLANMAINADVRVRLSSEDKLPLLFDVLDRARRWGDEELMLNIVSCITNMSYFSASDTQLSSSSPTNVIVANREYIASLLARILVKDNEEAVLEAARAFGNLTRFKDVLHQMSSQKVLDCCVFLLEHSNREIVYTICGVLMNAALDPPTKRHLLVGDGKMDVRSSLVGIVECAGTDDVEMTCVACKVLYNLLLVKPGAEAQEESDVATFRESERAEALRQVIHTMLDSINNRHADESSDSVTVNGGHHGGQRDASGEVDSSDWDELRAVLSQLLRGLGSAASRTQL